MAIIIKFAESDAELAQILQLQQANHFNSLTEEDKKLSGFVTVQHDLDLLRKMNVAAKQIIAIDEGIVVGYALVMLKEFKELIPVLQPMFDLFNQLTYLDNPLRAYSYYVMGQICIAPNHRGQGIFEKLYWKHREAYSNLFDLCLTEISQSNLRSMKAHLNVGFKTIHSFQDETDYWNIMLWDWV
jgi:hypothetical protein